MKIRVIDQVVRDAIDRYISAHGNMSQASFARIVDISEQTVGRWIAGAQDYAVRKPSTQDALWSALEPFLPAEYIRLMGVLRDQNIGEQSSNVATADGHAEIRVMSAERHRLSREVREMLDETLDKLTVDEQAQIIRICSMAIRRRHENHNGQS